MRKNIKKKQEPKITFADGSELINRFMHTHAPLKTSTEFICIPVGNVGDGYKEYGINDNDCLIVQNASDYEENQFTVWQTRTGENKHSFCGFAFDNFGDISIETPYGVRRFKKKEIELLGVVVGVVRCLNVKLKDKQPKPSNEPIEEGEITVVCDECKKELTASRAFIKAQGWRLRKKETLCLHCDL